MAETITKLYISSPIERALMLNRPIRGKGSKTVHEEIQFVKIDEFHGEFVTDDPKVQLWLEDPKNGYGTNYTLAGKRLPKFNRMTMFAGSVDALKLPKHRKFIEEQIKIQLESEYTEKFEKELKAKLSNAESEQIKNAIRYGELKGKEKLSEEEAAELKKLEGAFK